MKKNMDNSQILLQLHPDGCHYVTQSTKKFNKSKKWKKTNHKEIRSVIPGSVTELYVENGSSIKQGSPLLKFEAMKMENVVCASATGRVANVHVKVGETFPKGVVMLTWE